MNKKVKPLDKIKDGAIRTKLVEHIAKRHALGEKTKLFHELGIRHGRFRVDLALINGAMHGFEIKSEADTVERLPHQAEAFSMVFDKMTAVVAAKHLEHALCIVPAWWGIQASDYDKNGKVVIKPFRTGRVNTGVDARALVELLWRDEALSQLQKMKVSLPKRGLNRKYLYDTLVEQMPLIHLRRFVRETLKHRSSWRAGELHA